MNRAPMSGNVRSILAMLVAMLFFALMDAVLKQLADHYPVLQIAALRGLTALPLVVVYIALRQRWHTVWRIRWPLHLLRGALSIVMLAAFAYALKRMPLTGAYTLFFVAPLLITALSVPLLGEKVGPRRWTAIFVGLLGVLVVLRPTGEGVVTLAGLAVLVSASAYSLSSILVRVLHRTDSGQSMVFWMLLMTGAGAAALA